MTSCGIKTPNKHAQTLKETDMLKKTANMRWNFACHMYSGNLFA